MARASSLSAAQRTAIREIENGGGDDTRAATAKVLQRKGYIAPGLNGDGWELTRKGMEEYDLIMESGDGPETLKEMFRF